MRPDFVHRHGSSLPVALACSLLLFSVGQGTAATVPALQELAALSSFERVDLKRLEGGEILSSSETAMGNPRDIYVETCFLVHAPAESVAGAMPSWNPANHPSLGVLLYQFIESPPREVDFQALKLDASRSFVHWFLKKNLETSREKSDLYLSRGEAEMIASALESRAPAAREAAIPALWQGLLLKRAAAFERGGLAALPPYSQGSENITPLGEAERLLKQESAVEVRFGPFLKETCLAPAAGSPRPTSQAYWELSKVSDHATLGVGMVFLRRSGDTFQAVDCQHYSSGSLYLSLILSQLWPVVVDGRPMTLFWRGDFLSAPSLAVTRATERMACGAIMVQEIKKAIRFFREDVEKSTK